MGSKKLKPIKVILFLSEQDNKNTAAYNRDKAIEKMVGGVFEQQKVVFAHKKLKNTKNKVVRAFIVRVLTIRALFKIITITRSKNYNYVLFLRSIDNMSTIVAWVLAKVIGVKLAKERNEFPFVFIKSKSKIKKWAYKNFFLTWYYRLFDVLFVISDELASFYGKYTKKQGVVYKLPMTVDFSRFDEVKRSDGYNYIFYAGSLEEKKDGVLSLLYAFSKISKKHPDITLKIAGSSNNNVPETNITNICDKLNIRDKVFLLGSVSRETIPSLLVSAKVLVLPRPDSLQARGGFPTKLGEYLATGNPVICTRVGEIPQVLPENSVYFISPDNIIEELELCLNFILNHYSRAKETGREGRKLAREKFSLKSNQSVIEKAFRHQWASS